MIIKKSVRCRFKIITFVRLNSNVNTYCCFTKLYHSIFILIATSNLVAATTYYVSPIGSDSTSGTSSATPWQTVARVNRALFQPGDGILFQDGGSFQGCLVFSSTTNIASSSASNPVWIGSYGPGPNAKILANCPASGGTRTAAVTIDDVSGFKWSGVDVSANGTATTYGVLIQNSATGTTASNIIVQDSNVSGFSGSEVEVLGYALTGGHGNLDNVQILNNMLNGTNGPTSADTCGICGYGYGQNITNVLYDGNTVYDLGGASSNSYGGILFGGVSGGIAQYNIAHDIGANSTSCGGPAGIWAYASNNITIQYNEVYNVQPASRSQAGCDWDAYDLDGGVTNSVVQYNYSHNNAGNAWLAYTAVVGSYSWGNNTFRFNISENDGYLNKNGGIFATSWNPAPQLPLYFYNNTLYMSGSWNFVWNPVPSISIPNQGTFAPGSLIANNIVYNNFTDGNTFGPRIFDVPYTPSGLTIDNNIYWTTASGPGLNWSWNGSVYTSLTSWQSACKCDAHSSIINPLLANPGSGGTLSWTPWLHNGPPPGPAGYQLQAGSPALSAGAKIGGPLYTDYYQSQLKRYNIGAF